MNWNTVMNLALMLKSTSSICAQNPTGIRLLVIGKEKNGDVNKEVQTETVYHEHDCFYFDETLKSREEVNTHVKTFHGRPWINFTCEQCGLEFEDISDLKAL